MERMWPDYYDMSLNYTLQVAKDKGWLILLTCSTCGHGGGSGLEIRWDELDRYPLDMTQRELVESVVFPKCGHQGGWIDHRADPAFVLAGQRRYLETGER